MLRRGLRDSLKGKERIIRLRHHRQPSFTLLIPPLPPLPRPPNRIRNRISNRKSPSQTDTPHSLNPSPTPSSAVEESFLPPSSAPANFCKIGIIRIELGRKLVG